MSDDDDDEIAVLTNEERRKTHLMVAGLCAIYLRDALVLSGRDDVAGGLCWPRVRLVFLEEVAKLAEVGDDNVMDAVMLADEDDGPLKEVIGVPLIEDAARRVAKAFDFHEVRRRLSEGKDN